MVEYRVKRRRLAAASRAGNQNDAFRAGDHQLELIELLFRQSQAFEWNEAFLAVKNTQDDVFAMNRRLRRNAEIDLPATHVECDPAILWRARFGDVHAAHDLDTHGHCWPVGLVERAYLSEHAVDPVADAQEADFRLKVDVGGLALHSIGQQRVDQPDDRLAVFVRRRLQPAKVDFPGLDLVQDAVNRQFIAIGLVDGAINFGFAGEQRVDLDVVVGQPANLVERNNVIDVGQGDGQALMFGIVIERQQMVALGQFAWHQGQRRGVNDRVGKVDTLLAKAFGKRVAQGGFRNEAERNQQLADRLIGLHLLEQGDPQLIFAENALGDQHLAKLSLLW